jgi:hypothetical protein
MEDEIIAFVQERICWWTLIFSILLIIAVLLGLQALMFILKCNAYGGDLCTIPFT